jgi:hypothetical protein
MRRAIPQNSVDATFTRYPARLAPGGLMPPDAPNRDPCEAKNAPKQQISLNSLYIYIFY